MNSIKKCARCVSSPIGIVLDVALRYIPRDTRHQPMQKMPEHFLVTVTACISI